MTTTVVDNNNFHGVDNTLPEPGKKPAPEELAKLRIDAHLKAGQLPEAVHMINNLEKEQYIQTVLERAEQYYAPPHRLKTNEDGTTTKIFNVNYNEADNLEKAKYEWFFKAVNYDKAACEAILNPAAASLRLEIQNTNLIELMIAATK